MSETLVRTFIIKKRGRRYFECLIGKHKAQVIINDVSTSLELERVVKMEVVDLSTRNRYGAKLKFEPVAILEDRDGKALYEAAKQRNEAKRWLGFAEDDVAKGLDRTNAIQRALKITLDEDDLQERVRALREKVAENKRAAEARRAEQQRQRDEERASREQQRQQRVLFPCVNTPPLNQPVRRYSSVVVFTGTGQSFRINEDHPSIWYETLGHEGDYGHYVYYREATAEEITGLEQDEVEQRARTERIRTGKARLRAIRDQIRNEGERPQGTHSPEGTRYLDTQTIYGGGDWFIIGPEYIWYVQNNGADGDAWDLNNVSTGGAGAIGYRIVRDDAIATELQELAEELEAICANF